MAGNGHGAKMEKQPCCPKYKHPVTFVKTTPKIYYYLNAPPPKQGLLNYKKKHTVLLIVVFPGIKTHHHRAVVRYVLEIVRDIVTCIFIGFF